MKYPFPFQHHLQRLQFQHQLQRLPFRRKIVYIIVGVAGLALLMSSFALVGFQYFYERQNTEVRNFEVADVLAANLAAAVVFGDEQAATRIAGSVAKSSDILAVEVSDGEGMLVGRYRRLAEEHSLGYKAVNNLGKVGDSEPAKLGVAVVPIEVGGDQVGTLVLRFAYRGFWQILVGTLPIALTIFAVCLAFSLAIASWLRRSLLLPLNGLSESMEEVRSSGDLSARVRISSDPDFNKITRNFNEMLGRLERNQTELSMAMQTLAHARDAANAANQAKSSFLANMSHELRTPLNSIIGYAEMLKEDLADAGLRASAEDATWIYQASKQLLLIINDLLDLSKIEAGKMGIEISKFDCIVLAHEIDALLRPIAAKNANSLSVAVTTGETEFESDRAKLVQCLVNLGGNACKFTKHGAVEITIEIDEGILVAKVSDTGIGIFPEERDKIFEPFVQGDSSSTRPYEGTGLGLSLVKRLVSILGGSVALISEPGRGSVFTLQIPTLAEREEVEGTDVARQHQNVLLDHHISPAHAIKGRNDNAAG